MKVMLVSKSHEKLEAFFAKQGSFEIVDSMESLASNLDRLLSNIIQVNKFIILVNDAMDFASEIRALLALLNNPSALVRIDEVVFFFKSDLNSERIKNYIKVVGEHIKTRAASEPNWYAPHVAMYELKALTLDVVYKELLGKSSSTTIDPKVELVYREERGSESRKDFESSEEYIAISPYSKNTVDKYNALKEFLKKTENPNNLSALEVYIPEYEELKLTEFKRLGYGENKWVLMTGDRRAGSTTHVTALAVSAAKAGKSVLIVDFTNNCDVCEHLKVASVSFCKLEPKEVLDNSIITIDNAICVYANHDKEVLRTLLPYMQVRPNVFDRDVILISFDLEDLDLVLSCLNSKFCSLILSSLLFTNDIARLLAIDVQNIKTVVWLNDNVASPLRRNKLTSEIIIEKFKKDGKKYRFIEPILFEDFELEPSFYYAIEEVI